MTQPENAEDFVAKLVELIARCAGGIEEQMLVQIEEQIRMEFGARDVYIHRASWSTRVQRDAQIRDERRKGRSFGAIAIRYGMSRQRVKQICDES